MVCIQNSTNLGQIIVVNISNAKHLDGLFMGPLHMSCKGIDGRRELVTMVAREARESF